MIFTVDMQPRLAPGLQFDDKMGRKMSRQPSSDVLKAFNATESPILLVSGQGQCYRSGNVVLKPAKNDVETNWIADLYLTANCDGFRLPKPIFSNSGDSVHDGWQAWEYLHGQIEKARWLEKIEICAQFHRAISAIPYPSCFEQREQNPWVIADKVTWGELEVEHHPRIAPVIDQLRACLQPVNEKSQLIHGDFGGNIMFSDQLPPAIIDFSPYWRPVEFAIGVMIADAVVWEGADVSLIEAGNRFNNFHQHLARAELRRIIELDMLYKMHQVNKLSEIEAHLPLIRAILVRYG
ncbi:MAG: phosphotransferase [Candidatus Cloacimonetes bacterium]|nr:phosphotransferase [Candidatus Cloacimonadota bacterium]